MALAEDAASSQFGWRTKVDGQYAHKHCDTAAGWDGGQSMHTILIVSLALLAVLALLAAFMSVIRELLDRFVDGEAESSPPATEGTVAGEWPSSEHVTATVGMPLSQRS